jgi:hypothetical protein
MLNTGTVIGVSANVFGAGFPKTFVPSFAWGGAESMDTYRLDKAIETAARVMARRGVELDDDDKDIFSYIFNNSAEWRAWEHP